MSQEIKFLHTNDTTEHVQDKSGTAMPLCAADANVDLAADGANGVTQNGTLTTKKSTNDAAHLTAHNATVGEAGQKKIMVDAYNKAAKKAMEAYPGNTAKWGDLGFELTKIPTDAVELTAVLGGEAHRSPFPHKVEIAFDVLDGADDYLIEECVGDPTLPTAIWYPGNPVSTKIHGVRITPASNMVTLWWRITGRNTFGPGAPGAPFGGFIVG